MIRRARTADVSAIKALVREVIRDTYPETPADAPLGEAEDWTRAWVAEQGGAIAGMVLTTDDTVDDLWVARPYHRRRLGTALLAAAEAEIAARGHATARLRCVSTNAAATAFYIARGWTPVRSYPHERFNFEMTDFVKVVSSGA